MKTSVSNLCFPVLVGCQSMGSSSLHVHCFAYSLRLPYSTTWKPICLSRPCAMALSPSPRDSLVMLFVIQNCYTALCCEWNSKKKAIFIFCQFMVYFISHYLIKWQLDYNVITFFSEPSAQFYFQMGLCSLYLSLRRRKLHWENTKKGGCYFFFLSWTLSRAYRGRDKCQHPTREKITLKHESTDESESHLRHLHGNWKYKCLIFIAWNLVKNNRLNSCTIQEKKSLRSKEHRVAADDYGRDNACSQIGEMEVFFIQSNLQASCGWVLAKELVCKSSIICWC